MAESREKYPELREEFNQIDRYMDLWEAAVWGIEAGRRDALEEASKVADKMQFAAADVLEKAHDDDAVAQYGTAAEIAAAIRALET